MITIFYSSEDPESEDDIYFTSQYLKRHISVCINLYQITYEKYQENLDIFLAKERSNIYVLAVKKYKFYLKLIAHFNRKANTNKVIVLYNYNNSTAKKPNNALLKIKTNTLQIFVLKDTYHADFATDLSHTLIANIDHMRGWLINITKESPTTRTFSVTGRSIFNEFLSRLKYYYRLTSNYDCMFLSCHVSVSE